MKEAEVLCSIILSYRSYVRILFMLDTFSHLFLTPSCKAQRNLNSFFAIIMGLNTPAVSRLTQTWEVWRQISQSMPTHVLFHCRIEIGLVFHYFTISPFSCLFLICIFFRKFLGNSKSCSPSLRA